MKAVFITYGQSLSHTLEELLNKLSIRGFTRWTETQGRGSNQGEPHYGTHAWPSKNASIITIVDEQKADALLVELRKLNSKTEQQGLSVFVWNVEKSMLNQ
jgi:nitrogen regulatory protein PII